MTTAKLENLSPIKKKLNITVPKAQVMSFFNRACQKVGNQAKIKGFRPGKIPVNILEKYYAAEIQFEWLNFLVSDSYLKALSEHKLIPMANPKFITEKIVQESDYTYSVDVEVKPDFTLQEYKGIKIKKLIAEISEKDIEDELKRLQESLSQLSPAEETASIKPGIIATIDFTGLLDGKPFKGSSAVDYIFEPGHGQLLADFEQQFLGLKKSEQKEFPLTFPENYFAKELAGKTAQYKVLVKGLHNKILPKIDDEMAKDIGKESLTQVKKELKEALTQKKEREFRKEYAQNIRKDLLKNHHFDVPHSIVEKEMELHQRDRKDVEDDLRLEIILQEIADKQNIKATPQDVDARLHMLAQMYRRPLKEIYRLYSQNDMLPQLAIKIALDKTMDFLIDNATYEP